jgi:hypothetical protein
VEDLVRWLSACLDEDERIARAATPGPWRQHDTHLGQYGYAATVLSGEGNDTDLRAWLPSMSHEPWDEARNVWNDAAHIAEWDPARVLLEIDAKRRIIAAYENYDREAPELDVPESVLRLLATVYRDRPGFWEGWAP